MSMRPGNSREEIIAESFYELPRRKKSIEQKLGVG